MGPNLQYLTKKHKISNSQILKRTCLMAINLVIFNFRTILFYNAWSISAILGLKIQLFVFNNF